VLAFNVIFGHGICGLNCGLDGFVRAEARFRAAEWRMGVPPLIFCGYEEYRLQCPSESDILWLSARG
jgi:hypothetical protein